MEDEKGSALDEIVQKEEELDSLKRRQERTSLTTALPFVKHFVVQVVVTVAALE